MSSVCDACNGTGRVEGMGRCPVCSEAGDARPAPGGAIAKAADPAHADPEVAAYLEKHRIKDMTDAALRELVARRPADPRAFIADWMHGVGAGGGGDLLAAATAPRETDDARRAVQIVATLGPASWTAQMLPRMIDAGVNIVRLNFAHRRPGQFEEVIPRVRAAAGRAGRRVEVLAELQGPKFRTSDLDWDPWDGAAGRPILRNGSIVTFALMTNPRDLVRVHGSELRITMEQTAEHAALIKGLVAGTVVWFEGGKRKIRVTERVSETEVKAEVLIGGNMKARVAVHVPGQEIPCGALTAKDVRDVEYILTLDPPVEYIAVSFPQRGDDLQELIAVMDRLKVPPERRPKICPKIERPHALVNIDDIIAKSGSLMISRGTLSVELGPERVPFAQKLTIKKARLAGLTPIIVASQMMESMIKNAVPTRAEVSDVENAVFDGADALMLSSESAIGNYPVEAVRMMAGCALQAQHNRAQAHARVPVGHIMEMSLALEPVPAPDARKTLIVATLGPKSWGADMLPKMIAAGVNIFRLNCSHRLSGQFEEVYPRIRAVAAAAGRKVEVLGDLQGPKFRTSYVEGDVVCKKGDAITLALMQDDKDLVRVVDGVVRVTMAPTTEQVALMGGLAVGMILLMKDGERRIRVTERVSATEVKAEVLIGGRMFRRMGINVPDLELACAALTTKDMQDAEYLLGLDPPIEYVALSFPQRGKDLQALIDVMDRLGIPPGRRPKICPKIEKPQALTNLDEIIAKSGSLMVARGDLGVELGPERVPFAQKVMIKRAKAAGLSPVIVATQMMESMIKNAVPTHAESSDVANAVFDGADAVMLSGESAVGQYPVETVTAMAACVRTADAQKYLLQQEL